MTSVFDHPLPPCDRCGHSPSWHSFKDGVNGGSTDITSPDALFSCNGPHYDGCEARCPDYIDPDEQEVAT